MSNSYLVGFETHIMLNTQKKLFCNCTNNSQSCEICRGLPGFFCGPVNREAVSKAATLAVKIGSELSEVLEFYRKVYHYYDLMNGYQRTQHPARPFSRGGALRVRNADLVVPVSHLLLEQDPAGVRGKSLVWSRSGNPLIQLVTRPVEGTQQDIIRTTKYYLRTLQRLCRDLNLSTNSRTMKTDVNVSVKGCSFKYELKNLGSVSQAVRALNWFFRLPEEEKLLKSDRTVSYRGTRASRREQFRAKKAYQYLKQVNSAPLDLSGFRSVSSGTKSLYDCQNLVRTYFQRHGLRNPKLEYAFLKEYVDALRSQKFNEMLENLLEEEPKAAYKRLTARSFDSQLLRTHVFEWIQRCGVSREDHVLKSPVYLRALKELKESLLSKGVPFRSDLIEDSVSEYYALHK